MDVRCQRTPWRKDVEVLFATRLENGNVSVAGPLVMKEQELGYVMEPTVRLTENEAQMLMDELWHCGLRPSEGTGSAGSLAATERHLKDMQAIALGLLRKDGVGV